MDILAELLDNGEFFYFNCLVNNQSEIVAYKTNNNNNIEIDRTTSINKKAITDLAYNFSVVIDDSIYIGGGATSHGSCGFFCKKTGNVLNWFLMSTISDPFISVNKNDDDVVFLSSSGDRWVVCGDNIENVHIEPRCHK